MTPPPILAVAAVAVPLLVAVGLPLMWKYPAVAKAHKVSAGDIIREMYNLGTTSTHFNRAFLTDSPEEHRTRGSAAELRQAKDELALAYDLTHAPTRRSVLLFGKSQYEFVQFQLQQAGKGSFATTGTDDDWLFCAWNFLKLNLAEHGLTIPGLERSVRTAFPQPEKYREAVRWADAGYATVFGKLAVDPRTDPVPELVQIPPRTEFTSWLILARVCGLDAAAESKLQARWLSLFPEGNQRALRRWGAELLKQRRNANEPTPPGSDETAAVLCLLDREAALDGYSQRCKQAVADAGGAGAEAFAIRTLLLMGFYPNDDVYLALYGQRPFTKHLGVGLFVVFSFLGCAAGQTFFHRLIAGRLLGLDNNPLYQQYEARRTGSGVVMWAVRLATPVLSWLILRTAVGTELAARLTEREFFVGVYISTLVCGQVTEIMAKTIAMLLIRVGVDPDATFLDEIIALPLVAYLLLHFEADVTSVAAVALTGCLPTVLFRIRNLGRLGSAAGRR